MIVFDLACAGAGHVFEAWFGSTGDYEAQQARGLVSCPICGDAAVSKAVMAPNVSPKGNSGPPAPARPVPLAKPAADMPTPEALKGLMTKLAEAQRRALADSNYVGHRFADEARAIHHGETDHRPIHGVATPKEAQRLVEDGIDIAPLPFPVRPPSTDN